MDEELIYETCFALLLVLSGGVGLFCLRQPDLRKEDYLTGWGALTAVLGGVLLGLDVFGITYVPNWVMGPAIGLLGMGMLSFSVGFLFDQLLSRRIRKLNSDHESNRNMQS